MATAVAEMPAAPYPEIDQFKLTPGTTYQREYGSENIYGMDAVDYEGKKEALKGKIKEMILKIRQPKKPYKMHRGAWEEMPVSEEASRIKNEREQQGFAEPTKIKDADRKSIDTETMLKNAEDEVRIAVKQYMTSLNRKQQKYSVKNMGKKTTTHGKQGNTVQGDLMVTSTAIKPQARPASEYTDIVNAYMGKQRRKYASCLKKTQPQSNAGLADGAVRTPSPDTELADFGGDVGSLSSRTPLPDEDFGVSSDIKAPTPGLAGFSAENTRPLSRARQTPQETHWSVWQQRGTTPNPSSLPAPPLSARGVTPRIRTPSSRGGALVTPRPASRSFSRASNSRSPGIPICTPVPRTLGPDATEVFGTPAPGPNFPSNSQEFDDRAIGPKVLTNVDFRSFHDSNFRESPVPYEMYHPRDGIPASHARSLRARTSSPTRQLGQVPRRSSKSAAPIYEHPINKERRFINNSFKSLQQFESAMGPGYHSGYDESPMAGKYFRPAGGNGDYMHPGSHFQTTTSAVKGHFTIHPDWVSERKSGKLNLSHFTSSKDPNRFRYGSK